MRRISPLANDDAVRTIGRRRGQFDSLSARILLSFPLLRNFFVAVDRSITDNLLKNMLDRRATEKKNDEKLMKVTQHH